MSTAELEMSLDFLRAGEKTRILFDRKIHYFDISFLSNEGGKTIHREFLMGKEKRQRKLKRGRRT